MRVASIVQKGMASGRSSYVEMRALERVVKHNINASVQIIRSGSAASDPIIEDLLLLLTSIHGGYSDALTPNGILKMSELEKLLAIDSEISICLGMLESHGISKIRIKEIAKTLKELIQERKELVGTLRA